MEEGEVIQAMTENKFIEVIEEIKGNLINSKEEKK